MGISLRWNIAMAEVANSIWKAERRKRIDRADAHDALALLLELSFVTEPVRDWLPRTMAIARQYDRSIYDAAFVAVAEGSLVEAVTADEPLYNAVHRDFPNVRLLRTL